MWFLKLVLLPPAYFICAWHDLHQRFSIPVLTPPYFACLSHVTHLIQIINSLEVRSVHELCFRLTCSLHRVHCSLLPEQGKSVVVYFTSEHSFMVCTAQRLQAQMSECDIKYSTSDIYNFNSRLAHLYALWMEYIRFELESWRNIQWCSLHRALKFEMCRAGGREDWNWEPLVYTRHVIFRSCLPGCS